ncbi:hypothetical protein EDC01DRAFT_626527 [Geopyxis carbonaria]|nr:hypothetical protein EDC01DRAFT_626527 [Geopyxis carbonaria]
MANFIKSLLPGDASSVPPPSLPPGVIIVTKSVIITRGGDPETTDDTTEEINLVKVMKEKGASLEEDVVVRSKNDLTITQDTTLGSRNVQTASIKKDLAVMCKKDLTTTSESEQAASLQENRTVTIKDNSDDIIEEYRAVSPEEYQSTHEEESNFINTYNIPVVPLFSKVSSKKSRGNLGNTSSRERSDSLSSILSAYYADDELEPESEPESEPEDARTDAELIRDILDENGKIARLMREVAEIWLPRVQAESGIAEIQDSAPELDSKSSAALIQGTELATDSIQESKNSIATIQNPELEIASTEEQKQLTTASSAARRSSQGSSIYSHVSENSDSTASFCCKDAKALTLSVQRDSKASGKARYSDGRRHGMVFDVQSMGPLDLDAGAGTAGAEN